MARRGCCALAELDPVLDEEGRLAWAPLGRRRASYLFLGLDEGVPLFAPLVRDASARASAPGACSGCSR